MHLDKFDLNLLVALDALLTEKHVTRAAEKLFVSQPAMSAALARLRDQFGDQLLVKVGASLDLTPRAKELAPEVRSLIIRIRGTLRSEVSFDPASDERDFRLHLSDYVAAVLMPALMRSMQTVAPNIRCVVESLAPDSLTKVDHGIADFCITVQQRDLLEDNESANALSSEVLFEDDFVLVIDSASEAAHQDEITLNMFLALPQVEVRFAHTVLSVVEASIRNQALQLRSVAAMPSFFAAAALIPGTQFATFLPLQMAKLLCPTFGLAYRKPPIFLPKLRETLIWHRRNNDDPAHSWFRAHVQQVASSLGVGSAAPDT